MCPPSGSIGQNGDVKVDWAPRGRHGCDGGRRPARSRGPMWRASRCAGISVHWLQWTIAYEYRNCRAEWIGINSFFQGVDIFAAFPSLWNDETEHAFCN